ncbi:glyoxalase [Rhodococcus spelaei]|uniref:Glyoxalase n=1 Tax=Rhodococcus spelaei TaxID=2546320 RepID=A0A541BRQ0_9NOCA|nr:VOC family protein [Rhodococcus spelaei]TQF74991.1 glyoxalase [Rhodococcus spelaei]
MTPCISLIGLVTADMARSFDIYRRLGLDLPAESVTEPHFEVTLPGGLRLAWDTVDTIRSFHPDFTPSAGGPALAFDCGSPADVDAKYTELTGVGCVGELAPFDAFWGQRYATLKDPDGNTVDLFAALPG